MGKEGELWDDSALINAFDEAIYKYKKMHGKGSRDNSNDANEEDKSHLETDNERKNEASHASVEVGELEVTVTGNEVAASESLQEQVLGPNGQSVQDQAQNNSSSLAVDEYNELYKQYYEVEEQRQKILQRLQDLSSWSYTDGVDAPSSGVQWGTTSATQEYQSSLSQVPCGTMVVSCCQCACPCSMASCASLPCPSLGACTATLSNDASASMGLQKQPAAEDADFVKMAMGAAEKAISTLKNATSDSKEDNKIHGGAEANATPETDLSAVLNAWYSAGLYTGKYLTEQALAKKRHD